MPTTQPIEAMAAPAIQGHNRAFVESWKQSGDNQRMVMAQMHEHHASQLQKAKDEGIDDASIVYAMNGAMDIVLHDMRKHSPMGRKVQCKKGCAHCCHIHVDITTAEAALIAGALKANGIFFNRGKLERQAKATTVEDWRALEPKDRACVFLGTANECRIYGVRPMACRKYLVASNPKHCDTVRHMGERVAIVSNHEAEAITNVAMSAFKWGTMGTMLLEAIDHE